ncbi:NAD(P)-dependent dehydrogenase (short-subunit alcohol dehydrogenase family) [Neobacillus niacini]|uniref:SDR family NAD(P)-dependent oxidoreductase n=1 Tax=Neobacillus niacini TaxID=86668 RepID=UPI002855F881|nr:3-oxoacyl-ACP reductase family protein [Neobacillus niacini]MDR7076819.1 NAD(P)-dependent dehydrogenase (short-subunit alcohol dehydrogenase family) [Neobacillus niacini]
MSRFDLSGRVAIVTGGSKGLGSGMAYALAEQGADIVIVSRNQAEGELVAAKIRGMGRKSLALSVDVQDISSISQMVETVTKEFGRIDILINNAGVGITKFALEVTEEEWDKVVDTNLKGVFFCAQAVARVMKEQKYGKIINISSLAGLKGSNAMAPYCASKAGIINLTRALAKEWARYHINVNAIAPGYIKTALNEEELSNESFRNKLFSALPIQRLGELDDLAGTVVLLASEASAYITGQTIIIDGGRLI